MSQAVLRRSALSVLHCNTEPVKFNRLRLSSNRTTGRKKVTQPANWELAKAEPLATV